MQRRPTSSSAVVGRAVDESILETSLGPKGIDEMFQSPDDKFTISTGICVGKCPRSGHDSLMDTLGGFEFKVTMGIEDHVEISFKRNWDASLEKMSGTSYCVEFPNFTRTLYCNMRMIDLLLIFLRPSLPSS